MNTPNFIVLCSGILLIPVVMGSGIILWQQAFGQGTPTTTIAPQELTSPNPNLQYIPQKAFIVPLGPNGQIQAIPIQESSSAGVDGNLMGTLAGLSGVAAAIWAKISGKKELEKEITPVKEVVKDNTVAIVQSKEVEQGITKTMFGLAPEDKVKAMEGTAPEIKLAKLQENKEEATKVAAKAS
jgi:hypothetical protein